MPERRSDASKEDALRCFPFLSSPSSSSLTRTVFPSGTIKALRSEGTQADGAESTFPWARLGWEITRSIRSAEKRLENKSEIHSRSRLLEIWLMPPLLDDQDGWPGP